MLIVEQARLVKEMKRCKQGTSLSLSMLTFLPSLSRLPMVDF